MVRATMYNIIIAQFISPWARFMACSGISGSDQTRPMPEQYGPILVMEQLVSWTYWLVVCVLRSSFL